MSEIIDMPEYDSNPFTLSFKGFGLLVDYAKGVFIAMLVLGLLSLLPNLINLIPSNNVAVTSSTNSSTISEQATINNVSNIEWGAVAGITFMVISIVLVVLIIALLFSAIYKGFVAAGAVAASEKRMISFGEAFSEMGNRLGVLFKAEIITALKIIGGYFLLIIPGVRAQLRYQSTPYIIMKNKDMSASDAISRSKELYRNHLMESFGIATVAGIIPIVGAAVGASGMALSVQQLAAYKDAGLATPKTHWLNYIGLLFIGLLFLLVFSGLALAFALTTR